MATAYELQAARIESVFGAYGVPARVWQATVTPRFVRFDVTTALGTRLSKANNLAEELAFALGVRAVRVYREGGVLHVELPRDTPRIVNLAQLDERITERVPGATAALGIDEGGRPLMLALGSPDVAHVLIAGTTGSGKTALLRTMTASLAQRNRPKDLNLVLCDPKGSALAPLADLRHTRLYAVAGAHIAASLDYVVGEMERRAIVALPRLVVVIDELADIIMTHPEIVVTLQRLTQRGRESGIHVVAATQRPAAALVGGMIKANFPARIVGSVTSSDDAKVASGIPGTGAERLLGRGDMLLVCKGSLIRFQAAYADNAALAALVGKLGRASTVRCTGAPVQAPTAEVAHRCRGPALAPGGAPVQQPSPAPDDTPPAAQEDARGHLPLRIGGPNADDMDQIRDAFARLGTLNKTIAWAYGKKNPLKFAWVKTALGAATQTSEGATS